MANRETSRVRRLKGSSPDPLALPLGLEVWRQRVGRDEYVLFSFPSGDAIVWAPLTPRERTVASEILQGFGNQEIADRLGIAHRTVANQVASIFRKLQVGSRAELVLLFVRSLEPQPPAPRH